MQTAGILLVFLVGFAALFPWQAGRFRKWAGFAVAAVAIAAFLMLDDMLKSPGYSWLNRSAAEKALPIFYGLIFGAPAWSLKAFVMRPEGVNIGKQEVLPPEEGLHPVNLPTSPEFNIVFLHGVHGHYFKTWCKDTAIQRLCNEMEGKHDGTNGPRGQRFKYVQECGPFCAPDRVYRT